MAIKIYNSLTRKKEEFAPLKEGRIGMYVCGPTVYDEPHIGHLRSAYIFDVIRRYLIYSKYKVTFVRNVTDVDDKIINKARQEYPSLDINEAVKKVSLKYLDSFHKAMADFGIMEPDKEPRATLYIEKMKAFIQTLIKNGSAYESGGDVYFDIKKAQGYGKLSNQSLEAMESGARVSPGENKRDPLDFALWKSAKEGEPSWESPWGNGRPGWHIECSVMSSDILGDEFDIHGGGLDLIFPHHENEMAQSKGAGNKFARYWIHNGLLTINGQKMAKSLGNFITIKDFMEKYHNPDILKMFFLSTHYLHPIDYNDKKMAEAIKAIERIEILKQKVCELKIPVKKCKFAEADFIHHNKNNFLEAMDDDFNMPRALASVFELITGTNKFIVDGKESQFYYENIESAISTIHEFTKNIFGLSLINFAIDGLTSKEALILDEYIKARTEKNYKCSDERRKELNQIGIILEDTKEGTVWRRKV
ncbi:MAG: cysteine--tRNA ligase [Candidatus Omnitrophica bacterium]|nr:cysteine--tRNA ligase [Candidatus Omnitrophota bacterium]